MSLKEYIEKLMAQGYQLSRTFVPFPKSKGWEARLWVKENAPSVMILITPDRKLIFDERESQE